MTEVKVTRIIGTRIVVYTAWEPSALMGNHSTLRSDGDGNFFGRIGTKRLPPELDRMPLSHERLAAVQAWRQAEYQRAYAAILAQHPEAAAGARSMGEIDLTV